MADRFVALFNNYADSAVLGGGSWLSALPLNNLKDEDIGLVARSSNPLNASTIITADLGASRTVGGIALGPLNITPGATYRVRGFSDSGYSVNVYDSTIRTVAGSRIDWSDTGEWPAWEDAGFWFGIPDVFSAAEDNIPIWLVEILDDDELARYWKIEIFDAGNGDGYIAPGRLFIAQAWRPPLNYGWGAEFNVEELLDRVESLGGKETIWDRGTRRVARLSFDMLSDSDLFGDLFRLQYRIGTKKQIFIVPDPDDTANFQKRSFLATLKTPPPIVQAQFAFGTTVLDCKEVI